MAVIDHDWMIATAKQSHMIIPTRVAEEPGPAVTVLAYLPSTLILFLGPPLILILVPFTKLRRA